jgi:hypothetical protein
MKLKIFLKIKERHSTTSHIRTLSHHFAISADLLSPKLRMQTGEVLNQSNLLDLPMPIPAKLGAWRQTGAAFDRENYEKSLQGFWTNSTTSSPAPSTLAQKTLSL